MSSRSRIKKIYPTLTALERALLVLRASKDREEEDPQVRHTLPAYQVNDFNRYIDLMNGVNQDLGPLILLVNALCEKLSTKYGWLLTVRLWTMDSLSVAFAAFRAAREPITESEYQALLEKERQESIPVQGFAEMLAERDAPDDATDRGWQRVIAAKAKVIEEAIDSGVVAAHRRGRSLLVNAGSFYDWLGEPVPVYPEWGLEYDVRPDDEDISGLKRRFEGLREAVRRSPAGIDLPDKYRASKLEGMARFGDKITRDLDGSIRSGLAAHWCDLAAIDTVLAEVSGEFGGEDPLLPALRTVLDGAKASLEDLRSSMASTTGEDVDIPEPDEETIDRVRKLVYRELNTLTFTI